ncbi:hypothetical protein BKA67DRAFT_694632 [Truncatella angustata]|uniref:Uncharacterized protein n=1 Tax=Truncatella angustata TaxID=152316 RepID=A0A9P8UDH8_9PEZI|nr:uncharacterized protein BKA67DRAFT_694632 [Truncatella angustata]KAH6647604.1 hypothetical protein BKA67DRAFT_694632 [Truncatella angustata]
MQFTTSLIALLAAASASAMPGSSNLLQARQAVCTVTVQFFNGGCNGTPVGLPQIFAQSTSGGCINISGTAPRGAPDFAVLQNNATVDVRLYANDVCDENDPFLGHVDIRRGTTFDCSHLERGVQSIRWLV